MKEVPANPLMNSNSAKGQKITEPQQLRKQLDQNRQNSLLAARKGDYRAVARFTLEAVRLNDALAASDAEAEAVYYR
jgi:hypothetical protein